MLQKPPRSRKLADTNEGIPSSFITHLEQAKYEKRITKGKELEVPEDSETVKSFLHRSDPFRQLHYSVFHGEVGNMLSILPKRHYTLLIADIPYAIQISPNRENGEGLCRIDPSTVMEDRHIP